MNGVPQAKPIGFIRWVRKFPAITPKAPADGDFALQL
jgi:hypothetical protein